MIRDFTDEAKQELLALVRETEEEKWCDFTDWLGDTWYNIEEKSGILRLEADLSNANAYHKKIIDKNNTTAEKIESIFCNVYDVEGTYAVKLKDIATTLKAYNELLRKLTDIIIPKNGKFTVEQINSLINSVEYQSFLALMAIHIRQYKDYDEYLDKIRLKSKITDEEKDEFIRLYEAHYSEQTAHLNFLLEKLPEDKVREIKYYIYSSEEPYRSIYLRELESYTFGDPNPDGGFFYSGDNTINVKIDDEPNNPRGPFTTFFHESGHAIDYNYNDDGNFYSLTFRTSDGKSLEDAIFADVKNDISNTIEKYTSDPRIKEHLLEYIISNGTADGSNLTKAETAILKKLKHYYKDLLGGAINEAGSDIYGGVTGNIIVGDYGHWDSSYWYVDGQPTGNQPVELWAEFYSYKMTGNQEALNNMKARFPTAYKVLEEMAASMVK